MTIINYKGDVFEKIPSDKPGYFNWVNKKSHYLTVKDAYLRITEGKPKQRYFLCICKCGNTKLVHGDGIRKKRIKSCGCWKPIVDSKKAKAMGDSNAKHGLSKTRLYKIWGHILGRCDNPNVLDYRNYGARGISYDPRWKSFSLFYEDMHEGYTDNMTIERKDVNGHYSKENCEWVTMEEQQANKRNTVYLEYKGKKKRLVDWAKDLGVPPGTIRSRLRMGWSIEDALCKKKQR
ncbi:hypothetical protein MHH67_11210 [Bacillus sp. FSL K6-0047]